MENLKVHEMTLEQAFNAFNVTLDKCKTGILDVEILPMVKAVSDLTLALCSPSKEIYDEDIEMVYYPAWCPPNEFVVSELNNDDLLLTWLCALVKAIKINRSKDNVERFNYHFIPRELYTDLMNRAKANKINKHVEFALKLAFFIIHNESCDYAVTDGSELREAVWLNDYFNAIKDIGNVNDDQYVNALFEGCLVYRYEDGQHGYREKHMGLLTLFQPLDLNKIKALYLLPRLFPSEGYRDVAFQLN